METTKDIIYIYGLSSSQEENNIRYVGYTNNPQKRKWDHITESRALKTYRHKWIQSILKEGNSLSLSVLRETTEAEKGKAETETILLLKSVGANLVNGNNGGLGGKSPTKEVREKLSKSKIGNTWNKGRMPSETNLKALLEAAKRPKSKEHINKIVKSKMGKRAKDRELEDDLIVKMYELYNSGKSFDEVAKELDIKRSSLSNVFYSKKYYLDVREKYNLRLCRKPYVNQTRKIK